MKDRDVFDGPSRRDSLNGYPGPINNRNYNNSIISYLAAVGNTVYRRHTTNGDEHENFDILHGQKQGVGGGHDWMTRRRSVL